MSPDRKIGVEGRTVANKFVISLKAGAQRHKGPRELLAAVRALPADVEILEGAGQCAITIVLSNQESLRAAKAIDFADVESYSELSLL